MPLALTADSAFAAANRALVGGWPWMPLWKWASQVDLSTLLPFRLGIACCPDGFSLKIKMSRKNKVKDYNFFEKKSILGKVCVRYNPRLKYTS